MVKSYKKQGHVVAQHIKRMRLEENIITIFVRDYDAEGEEEEEEDEEEEEEEKKKFVTVDLELGLSAMGNVKRLHEKRKLHKVKTVKTEEAAEKAILSAEKVAQKDIQKFEVKQSKQRQLVKRRKRFWFEKYYWCISSENYLIIAGKDASQNEQLWRRHLRKGDVYVHADLHGAATTIIKNPLGPSYKIPERTLQEAGQFSLCRSQAWDSKLVVSAWWVHSHQVSKTAPTGEYLSIGAFLIRGKKNYLAHSGRLELGLGLLFIVSDTFYDRHKEERRLRGEEGDLRWEEEKVEEGGREEWTIDFFVFVLE